MANQKTFSTADELIKVLQQIKAEQCRIERREHGIDYMYVYSQGIQLNKVSVTSEVLSDGSMAYNIEIGPSKI